MAAAEMDIGTSALAALARTTYQTDLAGRKSCWVKNETAKALGQEIIWRAAHRSLQPEAAPEAMSSPGTSRGERDVASPRPNREGMLHHMFASPPIFRNIKGALP